MSDEPTNKAVPDEQTEAFVDAAGQNLIKMYEDDLEVDVTPVDSFNVEIVVSKALGSSERLEAKTKVPMKLTKLAVLSLYQKVFTPRALSHAKELIDYQLEGDRMAREMEKRNLEDEAEALKAKKGK